MILYDPTLLALAVLARRLRDITLPGRRECALNWFRSDDAEFWADLAGLDCARLGALVERTARLPMRRRQKTPALV